jgi:hypothetical protein
MSIWGVGGNSFMHEDRQKLPRSRGGAPRFVSERLSEGARIKRPGPTKEFAQWLKIKSSSDSQPSIGSARVSPLNTLEASLSSSQPMVDLAQELLEAVVSDVYEQRSRISSFNRSRKLLLTQKLGVEERSHEMAFFTEKISELSFENEEFSEEFLEKVRVFFHEVAALFILQVILVTQWRKMGLLDNHRQLILRDIKNTNWILARHLNQNHPLYEKNSWQLVQPSIYSWYHPSDGCVEKISELLLGHGLDCFSPSVCEEFAEVLLAKTDPLAESSMPAYAVDGKIFWQLLEGYGYENLFKEIRKKKMARMILGVESRLFPFYRESMRRLDRSSDLSLNQKRHFIQQALHFVGDTGRPETFALQASMIWRLGVYQYKQYGRINPSHWHNPLTDTELPDLLDEKQLSFDSSPEHRRDLVRDRIKNSTKFDLSFGFFSKKQNNMTASLKKLLEEKRELPLPAKEWQYHRLGIWICLSHLREEGLAVVGVDENWLGSKKAEKFRKLILKEAVVEQIIDFSKCEFSESLERLPRFIYVLRKKNRRDEDRYDSYQVKVVKCTGELKRLRDWYRTLQTIVHHQNKVSEPGSFYQFPGDELVPCQVDVFFSELVDDELNFGHQPLFTNSKHCQILRKLTGDSIRLGSLCQIFEEKGGPPSYSSAHSICAVFSQKGESSLPEFWPSELAVSLGEKVKRVWLVPQKGDSSQTSRLLAMLNSKVARYWFTIHSSSSLRKRNFKNFLSSLKLFPCWDVDVNGKGFENQRQLSDLVKKLRSSNSDAVSEKLSYLIGSDDCKILPEILETLQKEWDRSVLLINRYSDFFDSPPLASYLQLKGHDQQVRYSKILENYPIRNCRSLSSHPALELNIEEGDAADFEIFSTEQIKLRERDTLILRSKREQRILVSGPSFVIEALKEIVDEKTHYGTVFWDELNQLVLLPKQLSVIEQVGDDVSQTVRALKEQMSGLRYWIDELCFLTYGGSRHYREIKNTVEELLTKPTGSKLNY